MGQEAKPPRLRKVREAREVAPGLLSYGRMRRMIILMALLGCGGPKGSGEGATPSELEALCTDNCNRAWRSGCRANHDCSNCRRTAAEVAINGCLAEHYAWQECVSVHLCSSEPCYGQLDEITACEGR